MGIPVLLVCIHTSIYSVYCTRQPHSERERERARAREREGVRERERERERERRVSVREDYDIYSSVLRIILYAFLLT